MYGGLVQYCAALFQQKYEDQSRVTVSESDSERDGGTSPSAAAHCIESHGRGMSEVSMSTVEAATTGGAGALVRKRSPGTSQAGASRLELSTAALRCIERIISTEDSESWARGHGASVTHSSPESMLMVWENIRSVVLRPNGHSARARPVLFSFCDLVPEPPDNTALTFRHTFDTRD